MVDSVDEAAVNKQIDHAVEEFENDTFDEVDWAANLVKELSDLISDPRLWSKESIENTCDVDQLSKDFNWSEDLANCLETKPEDWTENWHLILESWGRQNVNEVKYFLSKYFFSKCPKYFWRYWSKILFNYLLDFSWSLVTSLLTMKLPKV